MELFFGSLRSSDVHFNPRKLVTFAIPDIGVRFKAPVSVEDKALEYAALLTLLEFIDINPQLFANRALELYCDDSELIKEVTGCRAGVQDTAPYLEKVLEYRSKMRFSINWVARSANPARRSEID